MMASRCSARWPQRLGLALCCAAIVVLILLPSFRSIMHESDQAAILRGAWELAHGQASWLHADFYNYRLLFFTYWLLAAAWRAASLVSGPADIVLVGNVVSAGLFSSALAGLLWQKARRLHFGLALAPVLAPALLMHAPYMAANYLSAAFLLWLFGSLARTGAGFWRLVRTGGLAFAAVGCRADAVLVLPALCWLTMWPLRAPWRLLAKPHFWAAVIGAAGALVTGRLVSATPGMPELPSLWVLKIFAAYTVFGLGAVALLLPWMSGWMARLALHARGFRRASYLAGLATLWLPFAYYGRQLFTTRHWATTVIVVLLVLCSRRWQAAWRQWSREPSRTRIWFVRVAVACAVLPLAVGLSLPTLTRPRLCFTHATTFPSADGAIPMGAYIDRMYGSEIAIPDYNQAIWSAALQAKFEPSPGGSIPIFNAPLEEIIRLACSVKGWPSHVVSESEATPVGYEDIRNLIKPNGFGRLPESVGQDDARVARWEITEVSPRVDGRCIVRVNTRRPPTPANRIWQGGLSVFQGDDFVLFPLASHVTAEGQLQLRLHDGRSAALFSLRPCALVGVDAEGGRHRWPSGDVTRSGYFTVVLSGTELLGLAELKVEGGPPFEQEAFVAQAVLPDYMNMRAIAPVLDELRAKSRYGSGR
jgi:hypothetical protein